METIARIAEELNYPGRSTLARVLRNRGIDYDPQQLDAFVKAQTVRQVQAPKYGFTGKIAAQDLHSRIFADLIDFSSAPSKDGERFVLVVQRVFDRKLWTKALRDKRPETVAEAFGTILQQMSERPRSVTTDLGSEFGQAFNDLMTQQGITIQKKSKDDINAIATIDAAIGRWKKALARVARRRRTDDWASLVDAVTTGQNGVPNESYLEGKAPDEVEGDQELRKKLRAKNQEFREHNAKEAGDRAQALVEAGQFRVMLSAGGMFTRTFKPKWSEQVYKLDRVDGAFAYDTEGNAHPTKFTQPVVGNAEDLPPRRIEQGGSAQAEERKRRVLGELAGMVRDWLGASTKTFTQVGCF